jgi:hypothetical protein
VNRKRTGSMAFVFAFGLAGGAFAQEPQPNGLQQGDEQGEIDLGEQPSTATAPRYWIADAALFIENAGNTASVLRRVPELSVQDPQTTGSQAKFMVDACDRALQSLNELLKNAEATRPEAVPPIRDAIAELTAAKSQAETVAEAAQQGDFGPAFDVTVRSTLEHLERASEAMRDVAREYNAGDIGLSGRPFRSGGRSPEPK